jgi:hypothetical protein
LHRTGAAQIDVDRFVAKPLELTDVFDTVQAALAARGVAQEPKSPAIEEVAQSFPSLSGWTRYGRWLG